MKYRVGKIKLISACLVTSALTLFNGCSGREPVTEKSFVGKWKSSKLETPIYLYENGEWEIKKDGGGVLQFGVWQYKDKQLVWSYKIGSQVGHESNAVLIATPREFQVQERDKTTTTFVRLD